MSGLCGWYGFTKGRDENLAVAGKMVSALTGAREGEVVSLQGDTGVLAALAANTKVDVFRQDALLVMVFGDPDYSGADAVVSAAAPIAERVAKGYAADGISVLTALHGSFAVALIDQANDTVLLAVDRMGACPLIYTVAGKCLVFGSTTSAVNTHPMVVPEINRQAIFDYVYFHMVPGPDTVYRDQYRLLPGSYVVLKNGKVSTGSYWSVDYLHEESRPFSDMRTEFLDLLRRGVRRASEGRNAGTFLSGGTDSSTVAGMLCEVSGEPAHTYSIGFSADGYDEMEYARITARHFGTRHHEYYVTPEDVVNAIPLVVDAYDQPYGNASAVPTYYCARMAKADGMDCLLAGDGGDELFGGNARYAHQKIFSVYTDLPETLRKGVVEPLLFSFPGGNKIMPVRKARSYVQQASVPMPDRLQTYNVVNRVGASNIFAPEFLAAVDQTHPSVMQAEVYHHARASSMLNRMLAMDLKFTLADNDLPKVSRMCDQAGIGVAYPLLNDDLVAFSERLPTDFKLKGTRLRWFFKEALRGFLPDETLRKTKQGFGLPIGVWMRSHTPLQGLAYSTLEALKARGIIQPEYLDRLVENHRTVHAAYYGNEIWVLMMLELWLQSHAKS